MNRPMKDNATACSTQWDALPAWGTATQARFWVAVEQSGPWGRDALTESHLDPDLGARLGAAASETCTQNRTGGHMGGRQGEAQVARGENDRGR